MFDVVSLHFTRTCNLNCGICYRKNNGNGAKPLGNEFFIDAVQHLAEITRQCSLGGGEPFLFPEFVKRFSAQCSEHGLVCNATTNGVPLASMSDAMLRSALKNVSMVSVSYDKYKIRCRADRDRYQRVVRRIKEAGISVGANLLVDHSMVERPAYFVQVVEGLYSIGVDRVFALVPKQTTAPDILKIADYYRYLALKARHFYVDDLTGKIITEGRYRDWSTPCHYGRNTASISEDGGVAGCSFDKEAAFILEKPEDVLEIPDLSFAPRYQCPHLQGR